MADDIDIDEHDVLDNPRIKTELSNFDDEDMNDFVEESYETYQQDLLDRVILECSVVLEDCGDSLKNNPCFCSDCEILFPTENALDSHKMTVHSLLAAVGRNKAIKSTSESSIFVTDSNMERSNLFNHCNKFFPDEKSVLKQLLTRKFYCYNCDVEFESEILLQQHLRTHPNDLLYCCPICSCCFKLTTKMLLHMARRHQKDVKNVPEPERTTYKCRFCAKIMNDSRAYNGHIRHVHRELYNKKSTKFECQPCNLTFLSADSEKIHRISRHAIEAETYAKSIDLDKQIKIEPLLPTISHRVSQQAIEAETSLKSVDQDKQIKIEPLSPTISHRVSEHAIEAETSSKSVDQDKQIKIEPLSPTITHRVFQLPTRLTNDAEKVLANLKSSPLPQGWMYFETPKGLEYMRMNASTMQMLNHLRVNKDLSVTVIFSTNEELTLNDNISSFNSISDYLKSVERWPLCIGTQIDENKYSTLCRGALVGEGCYRRTQVNPRCKCCRSLRHRTLTIFAQKRQLVSTLRKELKQQKRTVKMPEDIEEHDVLDNPRIKTEVIKYEDEDINDFDEESYETYQQDLTDPEIQECSVVLEDCGDSLKYNPYFCSDCEILFPTENALNSHKMTAHSFLAAVGRNKAIKRTSKSSISARFKVETDSNMEISNLCNHCNKVFPDEISFLKHYEELLTRKFICDDCDVEFESEISLQQHLKKHPSVLMYCCPICSCIFKYTPRILSHMFYQHQIDVKEKHQRVKTTLKCRFCATIPKDNEAYNAHIRYAHRELYNKKCHKFECQPCNLTFLTADSEKIHRVSRHEIEAEIFSTSVDLDEQSEIEPLSPTISHRVSQHEIEAEIFSTSVDLDEQSEIEPLSPTISHRVSQPVLKTYSKSIDLDKQIKMEPLSPTISHRVSQPVLKTYSRSVNLDKQIKIKLPSPTIIHRVSQHEIDAETSSKSVDLDKQIKIEPLSPKITQTGLKQEL